MIEAFIRKNGVTKYPPGMAAGLGPHSPTAYGFAKGDADRLEQRTGPSNEESLAKAKILTALEDLAGRAKGCGADKRAKLRDEARRWFFGRGDFEDWCDAAGLDPGYVRGKARAVCEHGLPQWRAAPGTGKGYAERKARRERNEP